MRVYMYVHLQAESKPGQTGRNGDPSQLAAAAAVVTAQKRHVEDAAMHMAQLYVDVWHVVLKLNLTGLYTLWLRVLYVS